MIFPRFLSIFFGCGALRFSGGNGPRLIQLRPFEQAAIRPCGTQWGWEDDAAASHCQRRHSVTSRHVDALHCPGSVYSTGGGGGNGVRPRKRLRSSVFLSPLLSNRLLCLSSPSSHPPTHHQLTHSLTAPPTHLPTHTHQEAEGTDESALECVLGADEERASLLAEEEALSGRPPVGMSRGIFQFFVWVCCDVCHGTPGPSRNVGGPY